MTTKKTNKKTTSKKDAAPPSGVTMIPTRQLKPSKRNRPVGDIDQLKASIAARRTDTFCGVLQNLVVYPEGNSFVVLAGHRRLAAAKALKIDALPCRVVAEDDATVTIDENTNRAALTPVEEANEVAYLLDQGITVAEAARRLGRTDGWVARRARLATLSPKWRSWVSDESCVVSRWPVEALEHVAALDEKDQENVAEHMEGYVLNNRVATTSEVTGIVGRATNKIKDAPFDTKDADLVPAAGACEGCPKRSDTDATLFGSLGMGTTARTARCLSPSCWTSKRIARTELEIKKIEEKYDKHYLLVARTRGPVYNHYRDRCSLICEWDTSREFGVKGGAPCVVVEDPKRRTPYVTTVGKPASSNGSKKADAPKTEADKIEASKERTHLRRLREVAALVVQAANTIYEADRDSRKPTVEEALQVEAVWRYGTRVNASSPTFSGDGDEVRHAGGVSTIAMLSDLYASACGVIASNVAQRARYAKDEEVLARSIRVAARLLGLDFDEMTARAAEAIPYAKRVLEAVDPEAAASETAERERAINRKGAV